MADTNMRLRVVLDLVDKAMAPLKRVSRGSKETAATLKAARDQLKQLGQAQKDVGSFRTARAGLADTSDKLKVAQEQARKLAASYAQVGPPTKAMVREMAAARAAASQLDAKFDAQRHSVQQLRDKLSAAGISTRNLASHDVQLRSSIAATTASINSQTNALKRQVDQQRKLAKLQQQATKGAAIGGGMAMAGAASIYAGKQVMRPVSATMGAFARQESATSQLKASMMKADGSVPEEFEKINELATKLGDRLPGSTADFTEMMTMLRRQGLSTQNILGGTGEAAALLGVQLQMPATEAAEFAAKMQDATRTSEKDMLGLMDAIQRTHYLGVDSGNMLQGFSKLSPVMAITRQEGLEFANSMAPLLVMMDQTGMAGESAGNAIRKVFQGGLDTKKLDAANAMLGNAKAGFKLKFTGAKGEFLGMDNLFAQLDKLKGLGENAVLKTAVMKQMFGDDAETLQVLNTIMDKGKAGYKKVAAKMADQANLQMRVDEQLGTFSNLVEAAQGTATNAMASIGKAMAPDLKDLVSWLGETSGSFNKWVQENQQLVRWLGMGAMGLAAFLMAVGALLIPLGLVVAKGMALRWMLAKIGITSGPITLLRSMFSWGTKLLPVLMRFGPVLLRFLGPIGLLITAGMLIYQNWDAIVAGGLQLWTSFSNWLDSLWNGVVSAVQGIVSGGVGAWLQALLNFNPLGILWSAITMALGALGIQVPEKFRSLGNFIVDGLIGGITSKLSALKDTVMGVANMVASWFGGKLEIDSPSRVFTRFGGFISEGAAVGIEKGQAAVRTAALAMAGAAMVPVAHADGPAAGPGAGALSIISSGAAMAPKLAATPAAVGGSSISITIHAAPGMDAQAIAQAVAAELDKRERAAAARRRSGMYDQS